MSTDDQELEELKRWWQENGRTVIAGIVLGLGTVMGWTFWQNHTNAQAEAVSVLYERLVDTAAIPAHESAITQADAIIAQHPDSGYAGLAALVGAHAAFRHNDADTAKRMLRWAIDNGRAFEVANVARVRLARVMSQVGEHDAALGELDKVTGEEFTALVGETRGDVLVARGESEAARSAYQSALGDESLPAAARQRIELKLDVLSTAGG